MTRKNTKVLNEISNLEKQLREFNSLLKATTPGQRLGQMSRQTSSTTEQAAPTAALQRSPDPEPAVQIREMSPEARTVYNKHSGDDQMSALGSAHSHVSNQIRQRHPKRTVRDLDAIENQIMARGEELKNSPAARASQPTDRSDVKRLPLSSPQKLSPMQARAQEADKQQIEDYTGEKHYQPKKGISFQLSKEPIYETQGENPDYISSTKHYIHHDGQPIGSVEVDHRRYAKIRDGDDAKPYSNLYLRDKRSLEPQVRSELLRHLKSDDFKDQLKQYKKPSEILADQQASTSSQPMGAMLTPQEIRQESKERAKEGVGSEKGTNFAPKAPLREFSRDKALEAKDTGAVPAPKKTEAPRGKSEKTKELRRDINDAARSRRSGTDDNQIKKLMHDPNPVIRNSIINALLSHQDPEHVKTLMDHDDADVRRKAFDRLEELRSKKSKSA